MSDYDKRLFAYQMAMALARSMRSKGLISAKEYAKIDTIIANKYGICPGGKSVSQRKPEMAHPQSL